MPSRPGIEELWIRAAALDMTSKQFRSLDTAQATMPPPWAWTRLPLLTQRTRAAGLLLLWRLQVFGPSVVEPDLASRRATTCANDRGPEIECAGSSMKCLFCPSGHGAAAGARSRRKPGGRLVPHASAHRGWPVRGLRPANHMGRVRVRQPCAAGSVTRPGNPKWRSAILFGGCSNGAVPATGD